KNEEDFDLFIKNYALIENLLTHYEALNEVIVLNMAFVLEHFDEVSLWLNSKEFKEKYEDINHPYPPLLNPDKLNDENYILNYEKIPANLAWEMNLPLPRRYRVAFFIFGASAHGTIWDFFTKSFDLSSIFVTGEWDQLYISNFYSIKQKDAAVFSKFFGRYGIQQDYKKIYLASHLPFLILVRDPISRLKTMVNHGGYRDVAMIENTTFHLNDNIDEVLDRRRFHNYSLYPNTEETMPYLVECVKNVNFSYTSTAEICEKQVYYMDANEVNPDKVMESMRFYAKFFDKKLDEKRLLDLEGYLKEKKWGILSQTLPLTMQISSNEEILNVNIGLKFLHKCLSHQSIVKEIFSKDYDILKIVDFTMLNEEFLNLKKDEKLFQKVKTYLNDFVLCLGNKYRAYEKYFQKETDILTYFKTHRQEALIFKKVFDKEFAHIKANRPDIVDSWKYYKEFEKICENL
ncbi:DUF2972 domain-containing protein, partial [Campylobacter upsaliensis]|nr:DUF2972 domain-containing protein [Campylobacter upsaliensis]